LTHTHTDDTSVVGKVVLDYEGVSKHHAEVTLREKLPEEVILGSDVKWVASAWGRPWAMMGEPSN